MPTDDNAIKIAVMQNQIDGLREQHKAHKEEITKSMTDLGDKVFTVIDGIRGDIKDIYEFINKSRGAIAFLFIGSSAFGAVITALLTHYLK